MSVGLLFLYGTATSNYSVLNSSLIYLVDWILSLILGISFVFYFLRLLGFLVSLLLRWFLWHTSGVRVNIESLKIAPLGGRVFLKNVTYMNTDMTMSVLNATLTWRYWYLGITRISQYFYESNGSNMGMLKEENENLRSRIILEIEGLEIFYYNRGFAYDNIIKSLNAEKNPTASAAPSAKLQISDDGLSDSESTMRYRASKRTSSSNEPSDLEKGQNADVDEKKPVNKASAALTTILLFLPVHIRIKRGSLVMGNVTTPSILVISYTAGSGILDITEPASSFDISRALNSFTFKNFQVWLKPNIIFESHRYFNNNTEFWNSEINSKSEPSAKIHSFSNLHAAIERIRRAIPKLRFRKKPQDEVEEQIYEEWKGLRRYIDNDVPNAVLDVAGRDEEYAKYSLILESEFTNVNYYWDTCGKVPDGRREDKYPEHGVELEIQKGTIYYGPWAEKQRGPIQEMFFPALSRDADPTPLPKAGEVRQYAGFKIVIRVKDEVIFRVPIRELSKDKEVYKQHKVSSGKIARPFGWLELKLDDGSEINTFTSYIGSEKDGWPHTVSCYFAKPELSTSVNHNVLFLADSHTIDCKVGFPLKWNAPCSWSFCNVSENAKLFFLREHTLLFTDLFSDFVSGDPTPYENFRPFEYILNWKMNNYKLYFNVNESNVIDNPLDFSSNKYLSFQGDDLNIDVRTTALGKLTSTGVQKFKIWTSHFDLVLDTPPWHTFHGFLEEGNVVGRSNEFEVEGSYARRFNVDVNTADHIVIKCIGDYVSLKFYGIVICYLFVLKSNYFGDHIKFQTFEEFATKVNEEESFDTIVEENIDAWKIIKTDNDIDVYFSFEVKKGLIILPFHMYSCKSHIGLAFDSLDLDIRFTDYYMDMQVDFSPISGILVNDPDRGAEESNLILNVPEYEKRYFVGAKSDITIDGLTIHTHRMFGLPPDNTTFYCNWEFEAGRLSIDSNALFITVLVASIQHFALGYTNVESGLNAPEPIIWDAANFSFRCDQIAIRLHPEDNSAANCISVDLNSFLLNLNDLPQKRYTNKLTVLIPEIVAKVICENRMVAYLETSLHMDSIAQKLKMIHRRTLQQNHIRVSDGPFHRAPFLLFKENRDAEYLKAKGSFITPLSLPRVHVPLNGDYAEEYFSTYGIPNKYFADISDDESDLSTDYAYSFDDQVNSEGKFDPIAQYEEEDFKPSYEVDPNIKYDSLIFDLGDVKSFVNPKSLVVIAKIIKSLDEFELETVMDSLQSKVVSKLKSFMDARNMVDNVRFVTREVEIKIGEFDVLEAHEIFSHAFKLPYLNISIFEPSLAFSKLLKMKDEPKEERSSIAFHCKEVLCTISNPLKFSMPLKLSIRDIEFWLIDEANRTTNSLHLHDFEFEIDLPSADLIIDLILRDFELLQPAIEEMKVNAGAKKRAEMELVYRLTKYAFEQERNQDPDILTKPPYILRFNKDHMRFYDCWKMVIKLRDLLLRVDSTWLAENKLCFRNQNWTCSPEAREYVSNKFSTWRSWESKNHLRSFFLDAVFGDQAKEADPKQADVQIHLSKCSIRLLGPKQADFINLSGFTTTLSLLDEVQKLLTSYILSKIENVAHLMEYDSKISDLTISLIITSMKSLKRYSSLRAKNANSEMNEEEPNPENSLSFSVKKRQRNISFLINVGRYNQILQAISAGVHFEGDNFITTFDAIALGDTLATTLGFNLDKVKTVIFGDLAHQVLSLEITDIRCLLALTGEINEGCKVVDIKMGKFNFALREDALFKSLLFFRDKDLPFIESTMTFFSSSDEKSADNMPLSRSRSSSLLLGLKHFGLVTFNFRTHEGTWELDLSPIKLSGLIYDTRISFDLASAVTMAQIYVQKYHLNFRIESASVLDFENSYILATLKLAEIHDMLMLVTSIRLNYTKFHTPRIITALNLCLPAVEKLKLRLIKYQEFSNSLKKTDNCRSKIHGEPDSPKSESIFSKIGMKISVNNNYFGISTLLDRTRYAFEVDNFFLNLTNIDITSGSSNSLLMPYAGEIDIGGARLSVIDRLVSVYLSTVVDFAIEARIYNESQNSKRNLLFKSSHSRVCISLAPIIRLVHLVDSVSNVLVEYKGLCKSVVSDVKADTVEVDNESEEIFSVFSSINILCYNFCVGWIFDDNNRSYPGIMLGAERFYAAMDRGIGKYTVVDGYLSVANGARSSDFYSTLSQFDSANRAFLASTQVTYTTREENNLKKLRLYVSGDGLDIKFLSDSSVILEIAAKSISNLKDFFDKRESYKLKPNVSNTPTEVNADPLATLGTNYHSIDFLASLGSSKVLFYRLHESPTKESAPELSLMFPAVKVAANYVHTKDLQRKHSIKADVFTASSDNTLYAACVPVLIDMASGVKRAMKGTANVKQKPKQISEQNQTQGLAAMLKNVDIHLGWKMESQKLSLSCEPTARVETVVGIDGILFQANMVDEAEPKIAAAVLIGDIYATLQHVYSREVSGTISINNIVSLTSIHLKNISDVISATSFSKVNGYVNVKQFQDLNLFKDVWIPSKVSERKELLVVTTKDTLKSELASNKNIASRFKEVSETYAVPWMVTLIFKEISLRVNFGTTLGVFLLSMDHLWGVSKKTTDWAQDLKVGLRSLKLHGNGRLSGDIDVSEIQLHTAISWRSQGKMLDVPLILISGGISSLSLKTLFDYHTFAIANIQRLSFDLFNSKGEVTTKDLLSAISKCENAEIYITSLMPATVVDISNAVIRMAQENRSSYREILRDSSKEKELRKTNYLKASLDILQTVKKLEARFECVVGRLLLHVYPSSFEDSKVLVVKLDQSHATFKQNEYAKGVSNDLELMLNDWTISLSSIKQALSEFINQCNVEEFTAHAAKAKGGAIVIFPSLKISMRTFQKYNTKLIEYLYQSSFGGTVNIRWNLGQINFIREMISICTRALDARKDFQNKSATTFSIDMIDKKDGDFKEYTNEEIDQAIEETIDKVTEHLEYTYEALVPPVIETPQIRELGNATPPMEWFGVHRNKFPIATHQIAIVALQKLLHEVEVQYSKVLGKA